VQQLPPNYENLVPPTIVVPVGQTVRMKVRSTDVVHSFYAPHFLYKIQAIPGNVNELHFTVKKAGVYTGQCYQFCGLRHADMLFVIDAREPAEYQRWLSEQRAAQGLPAVPAAGAEAR
jgi:cytochrome c oxidase subunit 2